MPIPAESYSTDPSASRNASEFQTDRNLPCAGATEVGSCGANGCVGAVVPDGSTNKTEVRLTNVHVRVAQVRMVEHLGEGTFRAEMQLFGNRKALADAGRKIDEARSRPRASPRSICSLQCTATTPDWADKSPSMRTRDRRTMSKNPRRTIPARMPDDDEFSKKRHGAGYSSRLAQPGAE